MEDDAIGARPHPAAQKSGRFAASRSGIRLVAGVFLAVLAYHLLQAGRRVGPWIFPDEVRYAEFARAVAEQGSASVAGERPVFGSLQSYLLAPAWLADDPGIAWALSKSINVLAFCLTAIPVFFLARRYVNLPLATLTAATAVLLPSAFYASTMMQEAIALPIALTAALLATRLIERFRWWDLAALGLVSAAGVGARGQLVIIPFAAAVAFLIHTGATLARRRTPDWRPCWVALGLIAVGAALFSQVHDFSLLGAGRRNAVKDPSRFFDVILNSTGAMIVGTAVIPVIALAVLFATIGGRDRARAALGATAMGFTVVFLAYTGLKSASQDFAFITLVEERNLIYLQPIAIVAVAAIVSTTSRAAIGAATFVVGAILIALPITAVGSASVLSENPGLSWVWHLHEVWDVDLELPLTLIMLVVAGVGAILIARGGQMGKCLILTAAAGALMGAFAYKGDHKFGRDLAAAWLKPDRLWLDRATSRADTTVLVTKEIADLNGIYLLAFWNRSIRAYATLDGASGPGIAGSIATTDKDGTFPTDSSNYVLHPGVLTLRGLPIPVPASVNYRLTKTGGSPARIDTRIDGVAPDGWAGDQFSVRRLGNGSAGVLKVWFSAKTAFFQRPRLVRATVGARGQHLTVVPGTERTMTLTVPAGPFTAKFALSPTDSPGFHDPRQLSLQVGQVLFPRS